MLGCIVLTNHPTFNKSSLSTSRYFLATMLCLCAFAMTGCLESSFNLARESRLPADMAVPPGLTRDDMFLTLDFWTYTGTTFTSRDKKGKKLATVRGQLIEGDPIYLTTTHQKRPDPGDPGYEVVVINGVTEVLKCIPYRDGANIVQNGHIVALFEVVDDPVIKKVVLAERKVR